MIKIGKEDITIAKFSSFLFDNQKVEIDKTAWDRVDESFHFLEEFSKDKLIYGINTGLGPMAQYKINNKDRIQLQYNAIRSHAAGSGEPLSDLFVMATMFARLNTLSKGYSGIHTDTLVILKDFINHGIIPFIPEHGGVGASGDLVQLSHLALNLIGEGEVTFQGRKQEARVVLKECGIKPLKIHLREGLSLINGTSAMTGIGLVNLIRAKRLLNWSVLASCLINEIVQSFDDHLSEELNGVKNHYGQLKIAREMRNILTDSTLIRTRSEHLYHKKINGSILREKVQEYYSLRCVPQILGPVFDTLSVSEKILIDELNSVSDNPIIDVANKNVFHGGNFHGDYISLEMDKIKLAITKLSMLAERQLNYLLNNKLNQILPPFINLGTLGLNFGMQGMQFTATSTVAENQTLSNPMYVHSISCNNDNQDIVSMGTNAALITRKVIDNAFEVLAIEWIALIQCVDFLKIEDKCSSTTKDIYSKLRNIVPVFIEDTTKYKEIKEIRNYLNQNNPITDSLK